VSSREGRSPARVTLLIVGGVLVGVAVLVVALTSLGGGSSTPRESSGGGSTSVAATKKAPASGTHAKTHGEASAPAASPAETRVAVLNGTSTNGLAHKLSANLQQSGYSQATALNGAPAGSHPTTVVEYASGHHADAAHVAQALEVTRVLPMQAAVSSLAGAATVVVIAGLDKATPASGGGETAAGAGATP
jgi:hypothetical protein